MNNEKVNAKIYAKNIVKGKVNNVIIYEEPKEVEELIDEINNEEITGTTVDKLNYLNDTKEEIKEAIINKNVEVEDTDTFRSYADKISSIPAGEPELSIGGKNPVLVKEYHEEIPFSETNFPNITPTASNQSFYPDEDIDTIDIDLDNYDYVLYAKTEVEYIYTEEVPKKYSNLKKVIAGTVENFIRIDGDRIGYQYNADTKQDLASNSRICTYHIANYDINRTDITFFSTGAFWNTSPYGNFKNGNTQILLRRGNNYVRIDNSRMKKEAYKLVDAEKTKLVFDIKVYRVDKGTTPVAAWGQDMLNYVLGE